MRKVFLYVASFLLFTILFTNKASAQGTCKPDGEACSGSSDTSCCSGLCLNYVCGGTTDCANIGEDCTSTPCCWGDCTNNVCVQRTPAPPGGTGGDDTVLDLGKITENCPNGINTAIGCVPIDTFANTAGFLLRWAIGVAGGIAIVLIIIAGIQILTSSGDPKRLQAGKELLTSAITGVILLVFSIFVLRIVGVNILGII